MKTLTPIRYILFNLTLFFVIFLLCEVGYRIYEFYFYKRQLRKMDTYIVEPLPNDKILQYRLKPGGYYLFSQKIVYKINANGLRDYDLQKEDMNYKIVILGDSYTFGWGLNLEDTYPKVLESLLLNEG